MIAECFVKICWMVYDIFCWTNPIYSHSKWQSLKTRRQSKCVLQRNTSKGINKSLLSLAVSDNYWQIPYRNLFVYCVISREHCSRNRSDRALPGDLWHKITYLLANHSRLLRAGCSTPPEDSTASCGKMYEACVFLGLSCEWQEFL